MPSGAGRQGASREAAGSGVVVSPRSRFGPGVGLMLLALLAAAGLSWRLLQHAQARALDDIQGISAQVRAAALLRSAIEQRASAVRTPPVPRPPAEQQAWLGAALAAHQAVQAQLRLLHHLLPASSLADDPARVLLTDMARIERDCGPVTHALLVQADRPGPAPSLQLRHADCMACRTGSRRQPPRAAHSSPRGRASGAGTRPG